MEAGTACCLLGESSSGMLGVHAHVTAQSQHPTDCQGPRGDSRAASCLSGVAAAHDGTLTTGSAAGSVPAIAGAPNEVNQNKIIVLKQQIARDGIAWGKVWEQGLPIPSHYCVHQKWSRPTKFALQARTVAAGAGRIGALGALLFGRVGIAHEQLQGGAPGGDPVVEGLDGARCLLHAGHAHQRPHAPGAVAGVQQTAVLDGSERGEELDEVLSPSQRQVLSTAVEDCSLQEGL